MLRKTKLAAGTATAIVLLAASTYGFVSHSAAAPGTPSQSAIALPTATPVDCGRLADLKLENVRITSATAVAAGLAVPPSELNTLVGKPPAVAAGLPAFCRVVGHSHPEEGSDIGFEVWMPAAGWDGRMHGVGMGGYAGAIDYTALGTALKAGQAAMATDTGHSASPGSGDWAKHNPVKVRDWAWRGIHLSTVAAKEVILAFYGRKPDKAYFLGCSGGGRQGLVAASRFPEDYDGIVSGAPVAYMVEENIAVINTVQAQLPAGAAIQQSQISFLQEEVLKQCDAKDGQVDGLVSAPLTCGFDASKLSCKASKSGQCFSDPQVAALKQIHSGAFNSKGVQIAGGYPPSGSEAGNPFPQNGWEGFLAAGNGLAATMADDTLRNFVPNMNLTAKTFSFDKDVDQYRRELVELDAPTDLRRFYARGGKLIIWHGWADPAVPPSHSLRWRSEMLKFSGPRAAAGSRLFMVPGVQHCFGGSGPDTFGQHSAPAPGEDPRRNIMSALQTWVEGKRPAPDQLVGRRGHGGFRGAPEARPERQRLICAYPKMAALTAGGDPDNAESYRCK